LYPNLELSRPARAQDTAYGRLQAMRRDKRSRNGPLLENRRFSAHVRDLIRDGRAEEARAKCEKQARRGPALRCPPLRRRVHLQRRLHSS